MILLLKVKSVGVLVTNFEIDNFEKKSVHNKAGFCLEVSFLS